MSHATKRMIERYGLTYPEAQDTLHRLRDQARRISRLRRFRSLGYGAGGNRHRFRTSLHGVRSHLIYDQVDDAIVTIFPCDLPAPELFL